MRFIKYFYYNGYADYAHKNLLKEINEYCKSNYCTPVSMYSPPNCQMSALWVVFEYKGPVSKKRDTERKIPYTDNYYYECSKCGFHMIEDKMTICPGCGSHFVQDEEDCCDTD
jgi:hypothetical protein